jgi:hypothetical protein
MLCPLAPTDAIESWSKKGQEGDQCQILSIYIFCLRIIERMMDLPVTVTILFECAIVEFYFSWETAG